MKEYLRVTPQCCEESTKRKVPFLEFPWEKNEKRNGFLKNRKPVWCVKAIDAITYTSTDINEYEDPMEAKYCPYCGTNLPEIELNPNAKRRKIYNTDSGDYCESCKERSMCCNCLPAPFRWKPIGKELILPKEKKQEEED